MEQQLDRERSARRSRVVGDVARPSDELLGIPGGVKERAGGVVPEPFYHCARDLLGASDPALIEGELVDGEKPERYGGMILEESADSRDTFLVRAHHPPALHHRGE